MEKSSRVRDSIDCGRGGIDQDFESSSGYSVILMSAVRVRALRPWAWEEDCQLWLQSVLLELFQVLQPIC